MAQAGTQRRHTKTTILVAAALLGWAASATTSAGAAPQGAPPAEVVAAALDGSLQTATDCDGTITTTTGAAFLKVERPGSIAGTISVDVSYGGTLVPGTDYDALPDPIEIAAGESQTIVSFEASRAGTVVLTIEPGETYAVGDPASATATVVESTTATACPPEESQTIPVGTAPASLDVYGRFGGELGDTVLELEGDVPPGLTFLPSGDWTGTATQVGTYRFVARYTIGEFVGLELPVRIVVVPAGAPVPAPPAAAPAAPVPGRPAFTG